MNAQALGTGIPSVLLQKTFPVLGLVSVLITNAAASSSVYAEDRFDVHSMTVDEAVGVARVRVSITPRTSSRKAVMFSTDRDSATNGIDFYGTLQMVVFEPGTTEQIVRIPILDDRETEPAERIKVRIFRPMGGVIATASGYVTITDNDANPPFRPAAVFAWLDDANRGPLRGQGPTNSLGYPRIMMTETQWMVSPFDRFAKYPIVATQAGALSGVQSMQRQYPVLYHRMFNPRQFMEFMFDYFGGCTAGISAPFELAGPVTNLDQCEVWAGHWVYNASTRLTARIGSNASKIVVADPRGFKAGKWLVIYDGSRGAYENAEHVRINRIVGNTIYLGARYNSTSRDRNVNAWVRQHEDGNYGARFWVFNLSNQCPRDSSNRQFVDHVVPWFAKNLKSGIDGQPQNVEIMGLTFDVDTYIDNFTNVSDVNNDLVPDGGIGPNGEQWWGEGVDNFYAKLRQRLPGYQIIGGVQDSFGFDSLDGVQIEGFPNGPIWRGVDDFSHINSMMSIYRYRMFRAPVRDRAQVQLLMKWGSPAYPTRTVSRYGNAPVRLGLALAAMDGGVFHQENSRAHVDTWYDEYAVVSNPGARDFGQAVNKSNISKVRAHTGWLGQPLDHARRIYDETLFSQRQALLDQSFDTSFRGWQGRNVAISRSVTEKVDGAGGLVIWRMPRYQRALRQASAIGPSVNIRWGEDYTVTFAAKAPQDRMISVELGNHSEPFLIGQTWRRYVMAFKATESGSRSIRFNVGQHNTQVNIDSVRIFRGNPNVFKRHFERGAVIANATPDAVSVSLGSGYRRIKGDQDPVNSGTDLPVQVTVPPYDAIFALKK